MKLPFSERIKLKRAYRTVFGTLEGQVVLQHICKQSGVFDPHSMGGNLDRLEGRRDMALTILKYMETDDEQLKKDISESYRHE